MKSPMSVILALKRMALKGGMSKKSLLVRAASLRGNRRKERGENRCFAAASPDLLDPKIEFLLLLRSV